MPIKHGLVRDFGHPYVEIVVSADGLSCQKFTALVDTGYSGFVSLPAIDASRLGLIARTTTEYLLADGSKSAPPIADGFACLEGDSFVHGLISLSRHTSSSVGVDFLRRCGKGMLLFSQSVIFIDQDYLSEVLKSVAGLEAKKRNRRRRRPADKQ